LFAVFAVIRGFDRVSIILHKNDFQEAMDCRVKPGNDDLYRYDGFLCYFSARLIVTHFALNLV
jgi:hypothetical protein